MSVNPNQGENPDSSGQYGGYSGYTPKSPSPKEDPYNAQWYGQQQADADSQAGGQQQQQQQYSAGPQQQQQQQQYYQPPLSATSRQSTTGGANDISLFGLSARTAALLSYLFTWVGGIFFLLFERRNRFVRFAAAQSITIFGPLFVLYMLLVLVGHIPFLGTILLAWVIGFLVNVLMIVGGLIWLFLMVQAYRGVAARIPIVSDYADVLLARFSRSKRKTTV
jgi:uncharacterized membrane protein